MPVGKLEQLRHALRLPGATIHTQYLTAEQLHLWLLQVPDTQLELDIEQIAAFWQKLPYWAFAWAGGRALARWINANPVAVKGKRVLDFGCGSALVGIAAAKAGAKEVWVADLDTNALLAAELNAKLNQVNVRLVEAGQWPRVDVLLASDVLYDISSSADLQKLMLTIPSWLLAESRFVKPDFVDLVCLSEQVVSTLPTIGDFDEEVAIEIYCKENEVKFLSQLD